MTRRDGETTKHTPGPWKFWDRADPFSALVTDDAGIAGIAAPIVRIRGIEMSPEEMRANARLIAAAPDLLEALRGIIEIGKRDLTNPKYDGYFNAALTALQKAEGSDVR